MEVIENSHHIAMAVSDPSAAAAVRRLAADLGRDTGLDETERGRVALVATELATNILKHARHGEILMRRCCIGAEQGVELIALDKGPGMADVAACMRDGFSTAGSPGTGLGAIQRLSTRVDIYSASGRGTVVCARVTTGAAPVQRFDVGVIALPAPGEAICGDGWGAHEAPGRGWFAVADGLGHGPLAATASLEALRVFRAGASQGPEAVLTDAHAALRPTRGAAMSIAEVNLDARKVHFAGIGNVAGVVLTRESSRSMVAQNGTVGVELRRIQAFEYPWPGGAVLVMASDGLTTRWDLAEYPGLLARSPTVIAATLYRDFTRGRDDATVLVVREVTS